MENEEKKEEVVLDQSTASINEEPTNEPTEAPVVEVKSLSFNELKAEAKSLGLSYAKNVSKVDLADLIAKAKEAPVGVMSLDNMPVSPIVLTNDKEEIPAGFIATRPTKTDRKNVRGSYNGRVYKETGNGYAIWCDNGQMVELSTLK